MLDLVLLLTLKAHLIFLKKKLRVKQIRLDHQLSKKNFKKIIKMKVKPYLTHNKNKNIEYTKTNELDENKSFNEDDVSEAEEVIHYDKKDIKTVFIKGINLLTIEEDLNNFIDKQIKKNNKNSHIIATRIALDGKGFSRGIAYVDFPNIETANRCIDSCNKMKLDESELVCVISKPPSSG